MSKGLEELELIKELNVCKSTSNIEKELKRLEEIDNAPIVPIHINRYNELSNKEKALEIIKEKRVDTRALIEILEEEWTWEQYMDEEDDANTGGHQFSRDRLTQEEYDLLKEVLL